MLATFIIYSHQEGLSESEYQFEKRRIDGHARTSIPLFRGSNLGIFVRKRPFATVPEHTVIRKEAQSPSASNENEHYRRFDDYSENPGPMFGR